jgi:hypothetical protein
LSHRSKAPNCSDWQNLRIGANNIAQYFSDSSGNLGILNGSPSGNTVDLDLDCPEALRVAPLLLPKTTWVFGRKSAPRSHWIFRTDIPLETAQDKFTDRGGAVLVELRGTGGQTMFPPSVHPSGERVEWSQAPGDLPTVELATLQQSVREVAAAALLARHWPAKGSRDAAAMALTGALLRAGWTEERVSHFVEAVAVGAGDEEYKMRASKAAATAKKQEAGEKTTGWPALGLILFEDGGRGNDIVERVRDWLDLSIPARIADLTPGALPWPSPPGEEAFYGLAGGIVRCIEPSTEADPAALLVQTLITFGNAAGRHGHFRVEASYHYANEFAVLVGKTSKARKGTSWDRIVRLLEQADRNWFEERIASGVSSGEGMIWAVRDPIVSREKTKEGKEIKYVDVEKDPGIADKRLLLYEPEFANVLKQTERQGNTASGILRQAWDGVKVLRTLTKNSPTRATDAFISMVGHITSEELQRYLTLTEMANGFANRFLFVCTDRSKLLPDGGQVDVTLWDSLQVQLAEALEFARSAEELRRDEEARSIWREVYGELSEGKPALAGALLARGEAHVMRLALIYALLDKSLTIQARHLLAALALWDYCERSVRFLFGDCLGDPVADEVLRLLRGCPAGATRTEIRDHFQRHASADRIGKALGLLLQNKLARKQEEKTGGRSAERWFAVGIRQQ